MKKTGICFIAMLFVSGFVRAQTEKTPVQTVMQKVIERAKANEQLKRRNLNYMRRITTTELDDSGRPTKTKKDQLVEILPPDGSEIVREENGRPVRKPQERSVSFEKLVDAFSTAFDFELAKPTESCPTCPFLSEGNDVLLLVNFKARIGIKDSDDDILNIMYRSVGTIYVNLEDLYIKRLKSQLTRDYVRGWGIFKLKRTDMTFEQEERAESDHIVVLKSMESVYRYSLFGSNDFEKRTWLYTDYRYIP